MKKDIVTFITYHYLKRNDQFKRICGHDFNLLKKHIAFLRSVFTPASADDLIGFLEKKTGLAPRNFILNFDDGLKEHAKIIKPFLESLGIKASFFIPTCILEGEPPSCSIIHFGTAHYGIKNFYTSIKKYLINIADEASYKSFIEAENNSGCLNALGLNSFIKSFFRNKLDQRTGRQILLQFWQDRLKQDFPDFMRQVFMSEQDILDLIANGHHIGLHTRTHAKLSDESFSEILFKEEIEESKKKLETLIGRPVVSFTYAFGQADDVFYKKSNIDRIHNTGIKFLFTTHRTDYFDINFIGRYSSFSRDSVKKLKERIWTYEVPGPK